MKKWNNPELKMLGMEHTAAGNGPIDKPDKVWVDQQNNKTWYSFPDAGSGTIK